MQNSLDGVTSKNTEVEKNSFRDGVIVCAKNFKSSWIELARYIVGVYQDKLYKDWGYLTFETYCAKEIGVRKQTALKLLRSYYFLEQQEPQYLKNDYLADVSTNKVPSYESVGVLRQVKNNQSFSIDDYQNMKRKVLDEGKGETEVKDVYRAMLKSVRDDDPEKTREQRRGVYVRRMLGSLSALKKEIEVNNFLSGVVLEDLEKVINRIKTEID
ncbi:MAG: hypothetical protein DRP78_00120 [Candidatus Omnitrophota bacterium]|nr:MAG: hypothetical protein DRP78_00120 [Candidatus Omnitrophota bacterium]